MCLLEQVIQVIEEALRRMRVTDTERKVILETLHYCQVQQQQRLDEISDAEPPQPAEAQAQEPPDQAPSLTQ